MGEQGSRAASDEDQRAWFRNRRRRIRHVARREVGRRISRGIAFGIATRGIAARGIARRIAAAPLVNCRWSALPGSGRDRGFDARITWRIAGRITSRWNSVGSRLSR